MQMYPDERKEKKEKQSKLTYNFYIFDQCQYKMQERILKTLYLSFNSWLGTVSKAITSPLLNDLKLALFKKKKKLENRYHGNDGNTRYSRIVSKKVK